MDIERAEEAWNLLIQRHGMMRVLIQPDGKQRILKDVPRYQIAVNDIRELGEDEKESIKRDLSVTKAVDLIMENVKERAKAKTKKEKEAEEATEE